MSRIGKNPIPIPDNVKVKIEDNKVSVNGPKGTLNFQSKEYLKIYESDGFINVSRKSDDKEQKAMHGTTRQMINNMVLGVSEGFSKELEIIGVGYRAQVKGQSSLELQLGFSHPISVDAPEGISFDVPEPTRIIVSGIDKQIVGQVAADIRSYRKPEPYKGKGVRYLGEHVVRKAGKAAK